MILSHVMRKPVFAVCEQQRCRSACASVQFDQWLCYSLLRKFYTSSFYVRNFKPLHSFCGCAGRFESTLVAKPWKQVLSWRGYLKIEMSRGTAKPRTSCMPSKYWSACTSAQSHQSLLAALWIVNPKRLHPLSSLRLWTDQRNSEAGLDPCVFIGAGTREKVSSGLRPGKTLSTS